MRYSFQVMERDDEIVLNTKVENGDDKIAATLTWQDALQLATSLLVAGKRLMLRKLKS